MFHCNKLLLVALDLFISDLSSCSLIHVLIWWYMHVSGLWSSHFMIVVSSECWLWLNYPLLALPSPGDKSSLTYLLLWRLDVPPLWVTMCLSFLPIPCSSNPRRSVLPFLNNGSWSILPHCHHCCGDSPIWYPSMVHLPLLPPFSMMVSLSTNYILH